MRVNLDRVVERLFDVHGYVDRAAKSLGMTPEQFDLVLRNGRIMDRIGQVLAREVANLGMQPKTYDQVKNEWMGAIKRPNAVYIDNTVKHKLGSRLLDVQEQEITIWPVYKNDKFSGRYFQIVVAVDSMMYLPVRYSFHMSLINIRNALPRLVNLVLHKDPIEHYDYDEENDDNPHHGPA